MACGCSCEKPRSREQPTACTTSGKPDAEKRIRLEASRRRRAHVLRAKLNEEIEEKRYRHVLSKRQHVQQEHVRSVRRQFRSWRKQRSPARQQLPMVDNGIDLELEPRPQDDLCPRTSILPASTTCREDWGGVLQVETQPPSATSASRPSGLVGSMEQGCAISSRSPSGATSVECTQDKEARTANQSCGNSNGKTRWPDGRRGGGEILPSTTKVDASANPIDSDGGVAYDGSAGQIRSASEQSRGGRWANLPPELRAIKDRWLGSSSEAITLSEPAKNIDATVGVTAVQPAHGYLRDEQQLPQKAEPGQVLWEGNACHANTDVLVEAPQCHENSGGPESAEGRSHSETDGEEAQRQYGGDGDSARRGIPSLSPRKGYLRAGVLNAIPGTSDGDAHRTNNTTKGESHRNRPQDPPKCHHQQHQYDHHHEQQQHLPRITATMTKTDSRLCKPSCSMVSPRSAEDDIIQASERPEGKAKSVREDDGAPRTDEELGIALAPAFGDALGHPRDKCRRGQNRKYLRDLRSRLHPSATDDARPAARATSPSDTPAPPPARGHPHARNERCGGGSERAGTDECSRTFGVEIPRRRQAALGKTKGPSAKGNEADDDKVDNSRQLGYVLLEEGETARVVQEGLEDAVDTGKIGPVPLMGVLGGNPVDGTSSKDSTSTTSRPSELFDSLELSVSAPPNGDMLARVGGTLGSTVVAAIPASARAVFTTGAVAHLDSQARDNEVGNNVKSCNRVVKSPIVVTAVEPGTKMRSGALADVARISPPRDGPPRHTVQAEAAVPDIGSRTRHASKGTAAKLSRPERNLEGSPTALPKPTPPKTSGDSQIAPRGTPSFSRLRAPGWVREALICSILPASNIAGATKLGTVPLKTARDIGAASTASALLPCDLLTPVTEVATVDEHSVASHGTRSTTRTTPESSVAAGYKPIQEGASGGMRQRFSHQSPHYLPNDAPRRVAAPPGICKDKARAQASEPGDGRSQIHRENRAMLGSSTIGSGACSAQGQRSAPWPGRASPSGGPLSSLSAYRASPTRGTSDGVGTRASNFSRARGERALGRQAGGGYIAAMGRRARSVARREAARRSAAVAMAATKARPSTPISERARWGKGRESQVEVERKKLLQRRAEYAEELQRKAKEDAKALTAKRAVATTIITTMLPADPRHVRAGAGPNASPTHPNGSRNDGADMPTRCRAEKVATAVEADPICEATGCRSVPDRRNKTPRHLIDSPADSPAFSRRDRGLCPGGHSSAGRTIGDRSAARMRQDSGTQAAPKGGWPEGEERRLIESIARLDTLLREDKDKPHDPVKVVDSVIRKNGGAMECKTARVQMGGVVKSRVRRGGGKETKACSSTEFVSTVEPKTALTPVVPVPVPVPLRINAVGGATISPGMFPPLFNRTPACADGEPPKGHCHHRGANEIDQSGPSQEALRQVPASHVPVSGAALPLSRTFSASEEQRWVDRKDRGPAETAHDARQQCRTGRLACESTRWVEHNNDQNGYGYGYSSGCAPPRYFVRREGEMTRQTTLTPARYWDSKQGIDGGEGRYGYGEWGGGGERSRRDHWSAGVDPQDYRELQTERGDWTKELPLDDHPQACGRDGEAQWVRRDGDHFIPTRAPRG